MARCCDPSDLVILRTCPRNDGPARGALPPRAASAGSNPAFLGDLGMTPKRSTAPPLPEADDDRHASVRVRLAALMLRRGDDVGDVSVATDVPVALLELLRAEVADETDLDQQRQTTVDDVRRRRRVVIAVLIMEVAALANIVIGLIALIGHLAGLGVTGQRDRASTSPCRLRGSQMRDPLRDLALATALGTRPGVRVVIEGPVTNDLCGRSIHMSQVWVSTDGGRDRCRPVFTWSCAYGTATFGHGRDRLIEKEESLCMKSRLMVERPRRHGR